MRITTIEVLASGCVARRTLAHFPDRELVATVELVGIDLQLCPMTHLSNDRGFPWGYSHTVLDLPRWGELFQAIRELETIRVTGRVSMYNARICPDGALKGESVYGELELERGDRYGKPWEYVRAGELARVLRRFVVESTDDRHCGGGLDAVSIRPALAYLEVIDYSWLVILRWH